MNKLLLVSFIFINLMFGQKNRSLNQPFIDTREKINTVDALATTVPRILSYQGLLTQPNGRAIKDGNIQVTFRLYTELDGGSHFWEESQEIFIEDGIGVIQHTDGRYLSLETIVFKTVGNDTITDSEAGTKVILKTLGVNDTITDAERW